jgi:c-di-GMP-binding flagellar brake protein YcgR
MVFLGGGDGVNIPERRETQQFPIRLPVTVKYTRTGHYEFTGVSRDLSASGMFLHKDSNIEEGAQVEIILTLPSKTLEQVTVQVRGTVVRVKKSSLPGIAINFEKFVILPEPWSTQAASHPTK